MENAQIAFYRKIKNGPSKQCASKVHISSDFQCLGCGKFFYQYGNGHFVERLDGIRRCQEFVVIHEKDIHHEADDFARRVMLPCILVAGFGELADDFLEDIPHFDIRDMVGVEVAFFLRELLQNDVEDALLVHFRNFWIKIETLNDFTHVRRKPLQVLAEVRSDVLRVIEQCLERVRARVVKLMSGEFTEALV